MPLDVRFKKEYDNLNKAQKEAVDIIDGPVMVVAGPGTGKTQILALRIGNILQETDTSPDSILCLTFTNSGVRAMKERLNEYIGSRGDKVIVSTFHSFALQYLIEKYYSLLGFEFEPEILSEEAAVFMVDEILHENDWEHIRPRANSEMYFSELKQLISILKRERLTPGEFLLNVEEEIRNIKKDPESISSRGESKGKMKKEAEKKIESLERTREVVEFYRLYEEKKHSMNLMDYDDILEYAVALVEGYEDVREDVRVNFQYILVDEHQDSSGVQNNFLKAVWGEVEKPNIFVVGDDRQLIYAFSGASSSYFEEFSHIFGKTKLITLTENYRSTSAILALADDLLTSSLADGKLKSNTKGNDKILLAEYAYGRDEIIGAGLHFKGKIEKGILPEECALLVPRNYHVRNAIEILQNMGLKVSSGKNISLFDNYDTQSLIRILGIIADPYNSVLLAESLLDKSSGVDTLSAHKFLRNTKPEKLTIEEMKSCESGKNLFDSGNAISEWGTTLENFAKDFSSKSVSEIVGLVGNEILIKKAKSHEDLIQGVEVVRSLLNVALLLSEKKNSIKLGDFLSYLKRIESYGGHIPLATFGSASGIQVMTLHKSKGLQYKTVWVAHMNEEVFMIEKKHAFTLPEKIKAHINERDILSAKRELYVAITRAKENCNISYASENYSGGEMELAHIIRELPMSHFIRKSKEETEQEILTFAPEAYVKVVNKELGAGIIGLQKFVKDNYSDVRVSVTLLNNFFECPWKWYFRNFLKLPEVKTQSLSLGSAVHGAIEFILKSSSLPSMTAISEKIKSELERGGNVSSSELRKMTKDGQLAVEHFIDNFYRTLSKDRSSERPLSAKDKRFPNLLMYGKLDLTERLPNGDIVVTDFKTGSSKTKNVIEKLDEEGRLSSHMRQLAMYSYLMNEAEKKDVALSRLIYLEAKQDDKNALYATFVSKEHVNLLVRDIEDYDKLLRTGEWINRPCNYNSYGKGTTCEYCKMAEIYSEL